MKILKGSEQECQEASYTNEQRAILQGKYHLSEIIA